jgi:hypothetical protein
MARTKQPSKRKRGRRGVPALGAAGVSLVMAGGASANAPTANVPSMQDTPLRPVVALDEEEIADVSLATFYIFDKENVSHLGQGIRLAAKGGCGGFMSTSSTRLRRGRPLNALAAFIRNGTRVDCTNDRLVQSRSPEGR